ncbi:MAG: hypothetical protein BWK80_42865 [Desulfobacteraceae bacterium IS3]|nr:MAG: hypothetical protein BWK80_42865 [Desulfobacteraceae bacterium IS3]
MEKKHIENKVRVKGQTPCSDTAERLPEKKVFINNQNKAMFLCPACEKSRSLNVPGYRNVGEVIRITYRCACGSSYDLLLERRKFFRKDVNLPGVYYILGADKVKGSMTVKNLSRAGLRLELKGEKHLKIGDKLLIGFCLDNNGKTVVKKKVVVRNMFGTHIGAEFCAGKAGSTSDKDSDSAIRSYIMLR